MNSFYIRNKNIKKYKRCMPCMECISKQLNVCRIKNTSDSKSDSKDKKYSNMIIDNNI